MFWLGLLIGLLIGAAVGIGVFLWIATDGGPEM
jgi:hypothetical protein